MSNCPFVAAGRIEQLHLFLGYEDELNFISHRMSATQPTSINIYGERRIGKSSLLYHFYQTWAQRIDLNLRNNFMVVYLSFKEARCCDESQFYRAFAQELSAVYLFQQCTKLNDIWGDLVWTREKFSETIRCYKKCQLLPVLCLDDIETALKNNTAFDEGFFDNLHSLMDANALMLVIVSFEPVIKYKEKYGLSSLFFNVEHSLLLEGFSENAINKFMQLVDSVNISKYGQALIRQWAGNNPYKLQLAGFYLFEAQRRKKDEAWAKQKFDAQLKNIKSSSRLAFFGKFSDFFINFKK